MRLEYAVLPTSGAGRASRAGRGELRGARITVRNRAKYTRKALPPTAPSMWPGTVRLSLTEWWHVRMPGVRVDVRVWEKAGEHDARIGHGVADTRRDTEWPVRRSAHRVQRPGTGPEVSARGLCRPARVPQLLGVRAAGGR